MTKDELQHIICGTSENSKRTLIQTVTSYLRTHESTGVVAENDKQYKQKEAKRIIEFCIENNYLINKNIDVSLFVSEGAEQKVYIKDSKTVLKLNDGIYYKKWLDYLYSLQLHNYFFPDTYYTLTGFCLVDQILYAVVEQPFVDANQKTELVNVKELMQANGFINNRNHDYYNADLGIILKDLHDENVLTIDGVLCFIDTVFYIKP